MKGAPGPIRALSLCCQADPFSSRPSLIDWRAGRHFSLGNLPLASARERPPGSPSGRRAWAPGRFPFLAEGLWRGGPDLSIDSGVGVFHQLWGRFFLSESPDFAAILKLATSRLAAAWGFDLGRGDGENRGDRAGSPPCVGDVGDSDFRLPLVHSRSFPCGGVFA